MQQVWVSCSSLYRTWDQSALLCCMLDDLLVQADLSAWSVEQAARMWLLCRMACGRSNR